MGYPCRVPVASMAYQGDFGNPVALEANAEEREVLGLISLTTIRSLILVIVGEN